jgi:phosphate transport system permease protein
MTTASTVPQEARSQASPVRRTLNGDRLSWALTLAAAGAILLITALLAWELWDKSALARGKFGLAFLGTSTWNPVTDQYGALPFIFGTVVTAALALLIAVPLGVGAAIFLAELAPPKLSDGMTFLIELLAAVPSVIFGLIGIFVLVPALMQIVPAIRGVVGESVPLFTGPFFGVSLLAAGVVLAVMVSPFIISVSREVLLAVPRDLREASLALGATRWETTWQVVVPHARRGILGSVFLALARALGETMAVTMVIGNNPRVVSSLLAPAYSIAAVIANEFGEAPGAMYRSALVELGLVLFALTIVINGAARLLILATGSKVGK